MRIYLCDTKSQQLLFCSSLPYLFYVKVAFFFSYNTLKIHHKVQTLTFIILICALKKSATGLIINCTFFLAHLKGLTLLPCSVGSFTGQGITVSSLEDENLI